MIIPIRCFTCSEILADKYRYYLQKVRSMKQTSEDDEPREHRVEYLTILNIGNKTIEGQILDDLGLKNVCCRRHFLTHVDIY